MAWPFPEVGSTGRGVGWKNDDESCEVLWHLGIILGRAGGTCYTDPGDGSGRCWCIAEGQEINST